MNVSLLQVIYDFPKTCSVTAFIAVSGVCYKRELTHANINGSVS